MKNLFISLGITGALNILNSKPIVFYFLICLLNGPVGDFPGTY